MIVATKKDQGCHELGQLVTWPNRDNRSPNCTVAVQNWHDCERETLLKFH